MISEKEISCDNTSVGENVDTDNDALDFLLFCVFDGASACKKALHLLSDSPTFLWPQRCACRGCSLLSVLLELISFANNHVKIGTMLKECGGSVLLKPALTRMLK